MAELRQDYYGEVVSGLMRSRERQGEGAAPSLEDLYAKDGLAAVIVDRPAEDALSKGFEIEGDEDNTVLSEVDRLDAIQHFTDAARWARLCGGGAILLLTADGAGLDSPLREEGLSLIADLKTYPVTALTPSAARYRDARLANYGDPEWYDVTPPAGDQFKVHETRLLRVPGDPLTYSARRSQTIPWVGRSALEGALPDLLRYRQALRLTKEILRRKQQAIYKMKGMAEAITQRMEDAEGRVVFDGKQAVMERLNLTDLVRSIETTVAVDGEDEFSILDSSLTGIDAVLGGFRTALAASAAMPVPILFGEGLSGLGNSGTGEQGIYHGRLTTIQERSLRPALERFVGLIWAQKELKVREPERWRLVFNPLWSPSAKEAAEAEKIRADAKKAEVEAIVTLGDAQYITPEEGRAYTAKRWPEMEIQGEAPVVVMPDDDEPPPEP
jgi:phage-related protein (TIGR01555 family)